MMKSNVRPENKQTRNKIVAYKNNTDGPTSTYSVNRDPDELICISDASNDNVDVNEFSICMLPDNKQEYQNDNAARTIESDSDCYIEDEATASKFVIYHLKESDEMPQNDSNGCLMCMNGFPTQEELLKHNSEYHAESMLTFKCHTCTEELNSRDALQKHMLLHAYTFKCVECGATFQEETEFAHHLAAHRMMKYQCLFCTEMFKTRHDIMKHKELLGHDVSTDFKCPVCSQKCNGRKSLSRHLRRHSKNHNCSFCKRSFSTPNELQTHHNKHLGIKPFSCNLCSKTFTVKGNMQRHVISVHGPAAKKQLRTHNSSNLSSDNEVVDEGEEFISENGGEEVGAQSATHRKTVIESVLYETPNGSTSAQGTFQAATRAMPVPFGGNKQPSLKNPPDGNNSSSSDIEFVSETDSAAAVDTELAILNLCTKCKKVCDSAADLEEHYITFHKRHKCQLCDSSFHSAYQLKDHINRHKGLKKVACTVCSQKFASAGDLKKHMNIHADVMRLPYACQHCDATFSLASILKHHVNQHFGIKPYKCTYCDKTFPLKGTLTIHMRTHPEYRPQLYRCELCGAVFAHHIRLKKHYVLKHPKRLINSS